ncbi:MAG: M28 family peptidase, partial [Prevotellaceae bacterium]|nr:M28 family peptidase [Prevotellaceae bacterium]
MVKYIRYTLLLTALVSVSVGLYAQNTKGTEYIEQIDSVKMRITLSALASDAFEGRGTGNRGGEIAQEYIVAYLDSCGIEAGNNGSYYQGINYFKGFNGARRRFTVNGFDYPDDYKYANRYRQDSVLKITEIIFVAAGRDIDSLKLDGFENKTVMKLDDNSSAYIDRRNPKTVISIISKFKPASPEISEKVYFIPPDREYKYEEVNISVNLADKLLASSGKSLKEIAGEVEKSGKSQIFTLKTSAEIHGNVIFRETKVSNILGIISGSELKNEYIVLSAHHDHVGIINGEIYNGADDNASGVSSVLEVARLMAKAKKEGRGPRRSVLVLFPAAEEKGLVGSNWYVNNPAFPLTDTKACINVDMIGRIDVKYKSTNGDYIYIVNDKKSNGDLLEIAEKSNDDNIVINTEDLNSLFNRSDHYNFARHNIPAVLLTSGLHNDYHTPRDRVELIDFGAVWKRSRFVFALMWKLANEEDLRF